MRKILFILGLLLISSAVAFAQSERKAYVAASNDIVKANGAAEKELLYRDMVERFAQYMSTLPNKSKDLPIRAVVYAFIEERDSVKANYYIAQLSDTATLPTQLYGMVKVAQKQSLNHYAEDLLKRTIDSYECLELEPDPNGDPLGLSNNSEKFAVLFYTDYALVLAQNGKPRQGLEFAKKAYLVNKNDKVAIATCAKLLSDNKLFAEAFPILEDAIRKGVADSELKIAYRQAYFNLYGEEGYQEKLATLNQQQQEKTYDILRKQMVLEIAPEFSLRDLDGKTWSLAELKGKTVVLDFWATWCAPCKKSFPAMQLAVNKYKNDHSVVFLFIHTWEHSSDVIKDVKGFISRNNYDFHVLMDLKKDGVNEVITKYKMQGIPAKFIIDGKGNIRFKVRGATGSNEEVVQELSAMIELAKAG